jgi:uncharacterized protein YdeI (YjbR/CyaY-like superfamily)
MPAPLSPPDDRRRHEAAARLNQPVQAFATQKAWATWLGKNHLKHTGLWMRLMKKGSGLKSITYAEALDEALCHGWIDGQKRSYDETSWLQKFTPRGRKSIWSKINQGKVAALEKAGRMKPAGFAVVAAAKADGRWAAAYEPVSKMGVPEDFKALLARDPKAEAFFATLKSSSRYAILFRLQAAKKPETRVKKMNDILAMLRNGEAPHLIKPK